MGQHEPKGQTALSCMALAVVWALPNCCTVYGAVLPEQVVCGTKPPYKCY